MRGGWKSYKIEELGRIVTGKTPLTQNPNNFGDQYPFITPRDMVGHKKVWQTERYLSEEGKNSVKNSLLPANSICVSCIGSDMGKVVITTRESITNQQLNSIICGDLFDPDFVYYAIVTISAELKNAGHHSTAVPILNKTDFSNFEITAPDLPTQRRTAAILSSLDEKIELNRQTNQTLEAFVQTLFKEWFVDFNFPGATGVMQESELGPVPVGWRVEQIINLFDVRDGTHDSPKQMDSDYYLITSRHLKDGVIDFNNAYKISDKDYHEINKRSKVDYLDILYSMIGTVGNILVVGNKHINFAIKNIGIFKTSQNPNLSLYINSYLKGEYSQTYFSERQSGSTQQYVTLKTLRELPVIVPDDITLNNFNTISKPSFELIQKNITEIEDLIQTRDNLLPKLMNGEIEA